MKPGLVILTACLLAFVSCKKNGDKPSVKTPDVYITGYDGNKAVYWKNGKEIVLPTVFSGDTLYNPIANAIAISNTGDIYIVGQSFNGSETGLVPLIWKNGVLDTLKTLNQYDNSHNPISTIALSITISGNDVYVGGYQYGYSHPAGTAVLWENDAPVAGGQNAWEFSKLIQSNGNIYSPGATISNIGGKAIITENVLSPAGSYANDIFISGSDIYLAGSISRGSGYPNAPCYWKNGVANTLTLTVFTALEDAKSICVSDSGVYVTAINDVIWKNGVGLYFVKAYTDCYYNNMTVLNKDVYIVGEIDAHGGQNNLTRHATLWKNNVPTTLAGSYSATTDIYVH